MTLRATCILGLVLVVLFAPARAMAAFTCPSKCVKSIHYEPTVSDYGKVITEALADNTGAGCTVDLHSGVYPVKTTIKMTSNSCLKGSGPDTTRLIAENGDKNVKVDGIITVDDKSKVYVSQIAIDAAKCTMTKLCKYNIKVKKSDDVRIFNVAAYGAQRDGVHIDESTNVAVDATLVSDVGYSGVEVRKSHVVNMTRSMAAYCGHHGFSATDSSSKVAVVSSYALHVGHLSKRGCGADFNGDEKSTSTASVKSFKVWHAEHGGVCGSNMDSLTVRDSRITRTKKKRCFSAESVTSFRVANTFCDDATSYDGEAYKTYCTGVAGDEGGCCPVGCTKCDDDEKCAEREFGNSCCEKKVIDAGRSCDVISPPCVAEAK